MKHRKAVVAGQVEQHRATEPKIVGLNPTISFCSSFSLQKMAPFSEMVLNREKLLAFVSGTHGKMSSD